MPQNTEFLPVTQDTAVQKNIEYSVKIGKQVMKKQLQAAMKTVLAEYKEAKNTAIDFDDEHKTITRKYFQERIKQNLRNDGEITRFRNMFNKFSNCDEKSGKYAKITNNIDIIGSTTSRYVWNSLFNKAPVGDTGKTVYENCLAGVPIEVLVTTIFPDLNRDDDESSGYSIDYLTFAYDIYVPTDILDQVQRSKQLNKIACDLNQKYNELELKLKNIDEVTEEMEAALLAQELQKTDEGKAALQVASDLITNILGESSPLLEVK